MATVVGILDRDSWSARTDTIIVADPVSKSLTWIPRDVWCPTLRDRINTVFAFAGIAGLLYALRELGVPCDYGLVLRRSATERASTHISVEVPVSEPLDFQYPLAPTRPIEEGHKLICFRPPSERLEGERIHQWIGARKGRGQQSSDQDRILRQQIFLRALLKQHFDFKSAIADPNLVRMSADNVLKELACIDSGWRIQTLRGLRDARIDSKMVLVTEDHSSLETSRSRLPQLAVVVLAFGAPSPTVDAVRSLLAQELCVEIVVVNSGGGGMAQLLVHHGLDVIVIEREKGLNPGRARNIGIRATRAPFVAFLEADCMVAPDWSRRRVFVHQAGAAATSSALENAYPGNPFAWAGHFVAWRERVPSPLRGGVSYDRRLFESYGFFREDLPAGEEAEFHERLPRDCRPVRNFKIRTIRRNPTRLSHLISEQFRRGVQAARFRYECNAEPLVCSLRAWHVPTGRAVRAYRTAKKNRACVLLALPIIPIAVAAQCMGAYYWRLRRK